MSAATTLEKLKEEVPGREYMLPVESAIKNYIGYKLQQDRNGSTGTGGRCRADFVLPDDVTEFLKRKMHGNINPSAIAIEKF